MKSIIQLFKFLLSGLGAGIDTIKTMAPQAALPYLRVLEKFTFISIVIPSAFVGLGFVLYWVSLLGELSLFSIPLTWLGYMKPLWRISILLGGASALGFVTILGVLASPIGALIGAATAPPQSAPASRVPLEKLPWYRWFSPIGILREFRDLGVGFMQTLRTAIERYISAVRFVLVVSGFGLFFFTALPRPDVTLFLFGLVGTWTIWLNRAYKTTWSRLAQAGAIVVIAIFALALIFSSLSTSFSSVFPKIEPEKLVLGTNAKEFTNTDLTVRWGELVTWVSNHWIGVTIAFGVVLLLTYLLVKMFRKTSTSAGTGDRQTFTSAPRSEGGRGSGWLGKVAVGAFLLLCVALIAKTLIGAHEERSARIDREIQVARANNEARAAIQAVQSAAIAAQAQQRQTAQQAAAAQQAPTQELWHGLVSPQKYSITLSTNLCERIPRPYGFSTRTEPRGLRYELWANGQLVPQSSNGPTDFPPNTTFIQYRWTNPPMNVIVGVGKEVK